jgi:hypothetical protein
MAQIKNAATTHRATMLFRPAMTTLSREPGEFPASTWVAASVVEVQGHGAK